MPVVSMTCSTSRLTADDRARTQAHGRRDEDRAPTLTRPPRLHSGGHVFDRKGPSRASPGGWELDLESALAVEQHRAQTDFQLALPLRPRENVDTTDRSTLRPVVMGSPQCRENPPIASNMPEGWATLVA